MTTIGEDLRTYVVASTTVNAIIGGSTASTLARMFQSHVPEGAAYPLIWFERASENDELGLDGSSGPKESIWDFECLTEDEANHAVVLADAVKARLHGYQGTMGNAVCKAAFVEDHDDDYQVKAIDSDEGRHLSALQVTVFYTT